MMAILRLVFAAATIAVIGLVGYYLIERNQAPEEAAVEAADSDAAAMRDMRKKARAAAKRAAGEGCTQARADYEVWEDYLDKKARRKLKALIARCDEAGEDQVRTGP